MKRFRSQAILEFMPLFIKLIFYGRAIMLSRHFAGLMGKVYILLYFSMYISSLI